MVEWPVWPCSSGWGWNSCSGAEPVVGLGQARRLWPVGRLVQAPGERVFSTAAATEQGAETEAPNAQPQARAAPIPRDL